MTLIVFDRRKRIAINNTVAQIAGVSMQTFVCVLNYVSGEIHQSVKAVLEQQYRIPEFIHFYSLFTTVSRNPQMYEGSKQV